MSETSFDTSAADTLTSGLSLGQCIKNAAEEFQPSENWFELQPTIEKEWHTLQGEPSPPMTMLVEDMSELPVSNVSSSSIQQETVADKEPVNPILRLFDHVKVKKPLQKKEGTTSHQAGPDPEMCTPLVTNQSKAPHSKARDSRLSDLYATPAISKTSRTGNRMESRNLPFRTLPAPASTVPKALYNPSSSGSEIVLSAQNISDLLEKDDSLAQRVKELLEEETSKSESSDQDGNSKNSVPALLQTSRKLEAEATDRYKVGGATTSNPQSEIWQEERIVLSDASLCSASDKTVEAKVINSAPALSLFSDSTEVAEAFNDRSSITGDTLVSLNSSKGTEYGDLPETVDIPHDIMSRLNNMRLITQKPCEKSANVPLRQAWTEGDTSLHSNTKSMDFSTGRSISETEENEASNPKTKVQESRQSLSAVPISGDVQFYTGSNPTTPQFPIEEEKLQQLQKYIEKKTGVPTISPLVAGSENVLQPATVKPTHTKGASSAEDSRPVQIKTKDKQNLLPENEAQLNLVKEDRLQSDFIDNGQRQSGAAGENKTTPILAWNHPSQSRGQKTVPQSSTPQYQDNLMRREPEGMSHPIASLVPPSSSSAQQRTPENNTSSTPEVSSQNIKPSSVFMQTAKSKEECHLDESLADESLLARIKSALTDSFSQMPISDGSLRQAATAEASARSDISFVGSIDSLAVQVKALLEEEVPQLISTDEQPQDTSNLSQVIENFEQTELWKFVAQFLPAAVNDSLQMQSVAANVSQASLAHENSSLMPDESMTELTLESSILDKFRSELRKSSSFGPHSHNEKRQTPAPSAVAQSSTTQVSQDLPQNDSAHHFAELKPSHKNTSQRSGLNQRDGESSRFNEKPAYDPVPGIPNFTPSVLYESSRSGESNYDVTSLPSSNNQQIFSPQKSFSHCRKNAKTVIASQLNRAAQRNFDVSLTPARHASLRKVERSSNEKVSDPLTSHSEASQDDLRKRSGSSSARSAYFRGNFELSDSVEDFFPERLTEDMQQPHGRISSKSISEKPSRKSDDKFTPKFSSGIPIPTKRSTSPSQHHRSTLSGGSIKSDTSGRRHRYRNVPYPPQTSGTTPPLTSGVTSPRIKTVGSGGFSRKPDSPGKRVRYSDEVVSPRKNNTSMRSRSKSPLRDRITVYDWLKSPEHRTSLERSKHLPTFDELMEQEKNREEEILHLEISEHPLKVSPTNEKPNQLSNVLEKSKPLQERYVKSTAAPRKMTSSLTRDSSDSQRQSGKTDSFRYTKSEPFQQLVDRTNASQTPETFDERRSKSYSQVPGSSTCPQMDTNDSYQHASLHTAGLPSTMMGSSVKADDNSDQDVQRRTINLTSSSDVASDVHNNSRSKIPHSLNEFKSLDEKAQHQVLKKILEWANEKRRNSMGSNHKAEPASDKKTSKRSKTPVLDTSLGSTQAVCDSDSTEYCDLPSTRPQTAQTNSTHSQYLLGMEETKAEQVMKRLLKKIQQQKDLERAERKKPTHKRNVATSSTPQRSRPPMVAPEASSIASTTDTDVGGKYYIKFRDRKYPGQRKVEYIEEISESEPTVLKVKRRHRRQDGGAGGRIVLYDRSVQTASSADAIQGLGASTNFSSPVKRKESRKKVSKAVQTASTQSSTSDQQEGENLDDTIVVEHHATDNKENIDTNSVKAKSQRVSSFYVEFKKQNDKKSQKQPAKPPVRRSTAWYEPFQYEPAWMPPAQKQNTAGLVRVSLQEALANQNPRFISKVRERQKRITINAEERRMQEIWAEERQRVFGAGQDARRKRHSAPPLRRSLTMTKKQIVAETKQKYQQLPEVVRRKKDEERKREYASHRLKAQLYKKKIQNKVLGRLFIN